MNKYQNKTIWTCFRTNKAGIPKKVLNMKAKGKFPRQRRRSDGNNRIGKMSHERKNMGRQ
jgi:hypothetical protein